MRKTIIAGNWKMNKTVAETKATLTELKELTKGLEGVEIVIGAPFTALESAVKTVEGSNVAIAAQNMHTKDSGAYTGEVSPVMLKEIGVKYVILGHSERRE
ncbi:MAG: triose-phosphate isomerase family protein, partial [Cetobacterium sp.]